MLKLYQYGIPANATSLGVFYLKLLHIACSTFQTRTNSTLLLLFPKKRILQGPHIIDTTDSLELLRMSSSTGRLIDEMLTVSPRPVEMQVLAFGTGTLCLLLSPYLLQSECAQPFQLCRQCFISSATSRTIWSKQGKSKLSRTGSRL